MTKIAIPIWDDRISPVLDTASRLLIVEVEAEREASRFETCLDVQDVPRRCFSIQGMGVDILICGAISRPFSRMLSASGIDVITGISGHPEDVLKAYLQGSLFDSRFLMPGIDRRTFRQKNRNSAPKKTRNKKRNEKKMSPGKNVKAKKSRKGGLNNNG